MLEKIVSDGAVLKRELISVCVCTYKRPEMLKCLLQALISQETGGLFSIEVVVVDNDRSRSAENVVKRFQMMPQASILYDCEEERNIALARNRTLMIASGNLIAFIDDDEKPVANWLFKLYQAIRIWKADGVLGPVVPFYTSGAPEWIKKVNIFDRRRFPTGTQLTVRDTRTGNVLLERSGLQDPCVWFDARFGRSGGEDVNFFQKQIAQNKQFVWCDEAIVYETVPPERWRATFHLRKYIRIGGLNGARIRRASKSSAVELARTIGSIPAWCALLLVFSPFGKHLWIRPALKLAYSGSCILAFFGLSLFNYRE